VEVFQYRVRVHGEWLVERRSCSLDADFFLAAHKRSPDKRFMHTSSVVRRLVFIVSAVALLNTSVLAAENPFLGRLSLTIPGGGAGWLGVTEEGGQLKGSILWGGGSVVPVTSTKVEGDTLVVTRVNESQGKDGDGKTVVKKSPETITAKVDGDNLKLTTSTVGDDGKPRGRAADFTGKRIPPVPPAPDLAKVKFGAPISLFNGRDLSGWKTMGKAPNGWKVADGILSNDAHQEPGKHTSYANLRTEREFEDFNLTLEFRVPKDGNSGVYLRGIYEVQVAEHYGKQ